MIAVYMNDHGNVASQGEKGLICLYEKSAATWQRVIEIPFDTGEANSIAGMRRTILDMVQKLEGCKAFVANEVAGQLYYILEANGFECFEAEGKPEEFLNSIEDALKLEQNKKIQKQPEPEEYILPTKLPGEYFVDMKMALI
jgi:Iron only nitrogenase protein AnfO (AnfO_nitrog).